MKQIKYSASLDNLSKLITLSSFILFIFIIQKNIRNIMDPTINHRDVLMNILIITIIILTIAGCYIYSPQKYILTEEELIIKRIVNDRKINLQDITEVRIIRE